MSREYQLDEMAQEAALHLLEKFWILRQEDPDYYRIIKDREKMLKKFFSEKLGYQLVIHRYFARLIKIPGEAEPWMGIQQFSSPKDYVILSCLLAFLEEKGAEEQFLLSELVETIQAIFPEEHGVDWTQYEDRKSLVRVLKYSREMGIIVTIEGEEMDFSYSEESEVLYENTPQSRYFLRVFPRELANFENAEDILAAEWIDDEENRGLRRRHRIYRRIFLSPAVYSNGGDDQDFLYIKNFRNIIKQDIEENFPAYFEVHRDLAVMVMHEKKQLFTLFPDAKNSSDIIMQLAGIVREKVEEDIYQPDHLGRIPLTRVDFGQLVQECRERFVVGWTKTYREMGFQGLLSDLLGYLLYWRMVEIDEDLDIIYLLPLMSKFIGIYPEDFDKEDTRDGEEMASTSGRTT